MSVRPFMQGGIYVRCWCGVLSFFREPVLAHMWFILGIYSAGDWELDRCGGSWCEDAQAHPHRPWECIVGLNNYGAVTTNNKIFLPPPLGTSQRSLCNVGPSVWCQSEQNQRVCGVYNETIGELQWIISIFFRSTFMSHASHMLLWSPTNTFAPPVVMLTNCRQTVQLPIGLYERHLHGLDLCKM